MEIKTSGAAKRTVLVLLDDCVEKHELLQALQQSYFITECKTADDCLSTMGERFADLSAAIIDVDILKANDCSLMKSIAAEPNFTTIPVLVATRRELTKDDMILLEEGAIDFLARPFLSNLLQRRIESAIELKRSDTFYELESMLCELPSNIFLKDRLGRYVFCTHYWHHLDIDENDPDWTIRGKTDLEIRKDKENALKGMEADKEIIRTGKGTSYVLEINADGMQEFMELIKRPVFDKHGNVTGIIALINDVTERELLKRELEKRAKTDELTGMGNHRAFDEYVREIIRSDDFPLAVISADCDRLKVINDTLGHLVGDEYLRMAALVVETCIPQTASSFRTGGDEFVVFLPHTDLEQAENLIEQMRRQQELFKLSEGSLSISYGAAVINNANDSVLDIVAQADRRMYADKQSKRASRENSETLRLRLSWD